MKDPLYLLINWKNRDPYAIILKSEGTDGKAK